MTEPADLLERIEPGLTDELINGGEQAASIISAAISLKRIADSLPQAAKDTRTGWLEPWAEHYGHHWTISQSMTVDVRTRDGAIHEGVRASECQWLWGPNSDNPFDVTAWRLHK